MAIILVLTLTALPSHAATIHVPAEQPTIQAGVDAANESDTVWVSAGIYTGVGNYGIVFGGKGIFLLSESGPAVTTIDCQGLGRAFDLQGSVISETTIGGFTITNGDGGHQGGAIECFGYSPTIRYCVFVDNKAEYGGSLYFNTSVDPSIENCTFIGNSASEKGGVFFNDHGVGAVFSGCLLCKNVSANGASIDFVGAGSSITVACSDLWENTPGDWIGWLAGQAGISDNFSLPPILCAPDIRSYGIHEASPLRPENSPCGQLVGAIGVSCSECLDFDADSRCAADDNCMYHFNPDQQDSDSDGVGDACEDDDEDGIVNLYDNCPGVANVDQSDLDDDGVGDVCDEDVDGDGVPDNSDNCPGYFNPGQEDLDEDGIGDACCCEGRVGDANGLGGGEPTIGDVSVMIDAKFITGTCDGIIACLAEADVNYSGGRDPTCEDITIGDISSLICYLFINCYNSLGLPPCLSDGP